MSDGRTSDEELAFYATPGPMTTLDGVDLPADLPTDPAGVAAMVQGLVIHSFWAIAYDVQLAPERQAALQIRSSAGMIAGIRELDGRSVTASREPADRLAGNCRDFATLTTAFLRHAGVPARARCGFAGYFEPGKWVDHWVVQHWDGQRWVMLDPQVDALQQEIVGLDNPDDLTMEQFMPAGLAWAKCQAGEFDGDTFGILDMWGQWFIESNVARDFASLNKVELLPWDGWGAFLDNENGSVGEAKSSWIDELAALSMSSDHQAIVNRYNTDPDVRVPATISSWVDGQVLTVQLPELV